MTIFIPPPPPPSVISVPHTGICAQTSGPVHVYVNRAGEVVRVEHGPEGQNNEDPVPSRSTDALRARRAAGSNRGNPVAIPGT